MKHFAIVAVLVVITTFLVDYLLRSIGLLPVDASSQAVTIDRLFDLHFKLISFLFSLITVFLVYSIVVFRRKPGETGDGKHIVGHTRLEVVWTLVPLATVITIAMIGSRSLAEINRVDPQALDVNVTAGQWYWNFEYPDSGVTSKELYLPVDRQVLLTMTSRDVIHSFWVPEFRVKQDVLPGKDLVKHLRLTPTMIGDYKVRCAEMCGVSHAYMESPVIVVSQADFDAWVDEQVAAVSNDPLARGKKLASENGCLSCHSLDGKPGVGPTWLGLAGAQVTLADDTTVTADEAYLRRAILDPAGEVVKGYAGNVMPAIFGSTLSSEQVDDLIAFIQSVK